MGLTYHHESTLPRINQIVWCRVPDMNGVLTDTVGPALVRGTKRNPRTHRGAVWVSYGTKRLEIVERSHLDLIIQKASRLHDLELPMAVRFDLEFSNWLPWAEQYFQPPEHSVYIVAGSLSDTEVSRLRKRLVQRGILRPM